MSVTDLYPDIIALTRTDRSTAEIHEYVASRGMELTVSGVTQHLRRWADAGAFLVTPSSRHGKRANLYRATRVAFSPGVLAMAVGDRKASEILAKVAQADEHDDVVVEPEEVDPPRLFAVSPIPAPAQGRTVERPQGPAYDPELTILPDELFQAKFGRDGVTISFDQFHRIVALLDHLSPKTA